MQILGDWIRDVKKRDLSDAENNSDPSYSNIRITPKRIVMHYSAGSTLSGAVTTLRERGLSYHVLIDVNGDAYQTRPFTIKASHAGRSNWKEAADVDNTSSLNDDSIGISFINLGQLGYFHQGTWYYDYDRSSKKYLPPKVADAGATKDALIYTPGRATHWTPFDPRQLATAEELLKALTGKYEIREIAGHHDIAIDEKPDPGPLAPLTQWCQQCNVTGSLGFTTEVASPDGELTLRDRPSVQDGKKLKILRNGDKVHIRAIPYSSRKQQAILADGGPRYLTPWASVDIDGSNTHAGFVYLKYLKDTPLSREFQKRL